MTLRGLPRRVARLEPFEALARAAAESTAAEADADGWRGLDAALAREARRRRTRRGLAAAALVLALGLGGGAIWRGRGDRLSYVVDGAVSDADGYIPRVQAAGAAVKFSDGTVVTLGAGSRARVVGTGVDGAQLRLEDGRAHLSVVHRRRTRWSVEAGPFVVQVTGTTFDVRWSAGDGVLHVRLLAGVVTVRGPLTRGGVTLQPGQELEARPDDGVLRIVPVALPAPGASQGSGSGAASLAVETAVPGAGAPPPAPGTGPATPGTGPAAAGTGPAAPGTGPAAPAVSVSPPAAGSAAAGRAPRPPLPSHARLATAATRGETLEGRATPPLGADWGRRIANGDFDTIVREAEEHGSARCLRELPSDRLAALGDAARYAGRADLARRALVAQRERFAGTPAAQEAAFLLGRLAEDSHEPRATALAWYDVYLDEARRGPYAAEALGRRLLLIDATDNPDALRATAREYLERHPTGPYASRARAILEGER